MSRYLKKHALYEAWIAEDPHPDLQMIVVIPCYAEPHLDQTLRSLSDVHAPQGTVEVLVVVNHDANARDPIKDHSRRTLHMLDGWTDKPPWMALHALAALDLPAKKCGVGLARKIGMDEAVRRFEHLGRDGLIINLDADCTCSPDYLRSIQAHFALRTGTWAAGVHFAHPLEGLAPAHQEAIVAYELHLRYFINAQGLVGLPFAVQTVGSCMVVRSSAYQKMGGMNVKKAGEDFYFLHKFVAVDRFSQVMEATVYPSARPSDRVPFGTGRAVSSALSGEARETTDLDSFLDLRSLTSQLPQIFTEDFSAWMKEAPVALREYLQLHGGPAKVSEVRAETSSFEMFEKRWYQWFNAFRVIKYVHFARRYRKDRPVVTQAARLARLLGCDLSEIADRVSLLQWYRAYDRMSHSAKADR